MTVRASIGGAAVALGLLGAVACTAGGVPHPDIGARPASDTARGIVQLAGSLPGATLQLVSPPGHGRDVVALAGADSALLRGLTGIEVMVEGAWERAAQVPMRPSFRVHAFIVRAVDGLQAHDGVVAREGNTFILVTRDGTRHPVPFLPVVLQRQVGARVYLVGALTAAPAAYGIISR